MAERAKLSRKSKGGNGLAHNSQGEGASREVFERWHRKVTDGQAAVQRASKALKLRRSELSQSYKLAKKEHVNIDALKAAIKTDAADHLQVLLDHRDTGRYLRWMGSPLGTQLALFAEPGDVSDIAKASLAGRSAGLAARSIDDGNVWSPGSEPFIAFRDAWEKGQAETRETLRE